ncbi:hypothetical protein RE428_27010 [Marinobacter nanhaiticus D15-8W]|uniref:Polysaccharide pyruvyl transferase family protein n=1 Tax=Marinobacter nanhaiticus D15-8W TaxID=626887 RepID=N6WRY0_9GAMM|nr:polysaccharide pyruvyl transferase family protein [Marinobacter nanhaiticus]ENO14296.1 polysaccharide pyruvyl transferase family protein [Marinobacter nanhaiticus D15-8W]BES71683.1 hypothetical protein RE428_27010 [Marinobacter nanhaiticus D15-8W]
MIVAKFNGRHDNLGDRLIFSCLCEELAKHQELYILGEEKLPYAKSALRLRQALLKIAKRRLMGERSFFFHPPGARFLPKMPVKETFGSRLQDRFVLMFLRLFQCPIHITGISIGQEFDANHYKRFSSIGVRDNRSKSLLSKHVNTVSLCPDMAFLQPAKPPKINQSHVALSFRDETPDDNYSSAYKDILAKAIKVVTEYFVAEGTSASFFSNVDEDGPFNRQLAGDLELENVSYRTDRPDDLDYARFFLNDGIAVSNRLHVLLPAMSEGLFPIALVSEKHHKIIDLFTTFGFDRHLIYAEQEAEVIERQLRNLLADREQIQEQNYKKLIGLRSQTQTYIENILTNLKKPEACIQSRPT